MRAGMCVCAYVCMRGYLCIVCMRGYVQCVYACGCTCVYMHAHMRVRTRLCACMRAAMDGRGGRVCTYTSARANEGACCRHSAVYPARPRLFVGQVLVSATNTADGKGT